MLQKESCCSQSSPCVLWNTVLAVQPGHRVHLPRPRFELDQLINLQINHSTLCSPFKNVKTILLENIFIDYL